MVPMVSLIERFHCTGQLTVVPMVSLIERFHCTGQLTVVPMVSLIERFHSIYPEFPHVQSLLKILLRAS